MSFLLVKKLYDDAKIPERKTKFSAGMDLYLYIREPVEIKQNEVVVLGTGVAVSIPDGYEGQVRLRSSLGAKGVIIPNGVGTIDSDYRGEIKIILSNISKESVIVYPFERVAQLIINKVEFLTVFVVDKLDDTERGDGGFGSTGRL